MCSRRASPTASRSPASTGTSSMSCGFSCFQCCTCCDVMTQDVASQVKGYLAVFGALFVLTAVTVAISYLPLPSAATIAVGLVIAGSKAALVAAFFMHLRHERQLIFM